MPTISREEATRLGMTQVEIPTISREEAGRLNMKPLGMDNQANHSNDLSQNNENKKTERGYATSLARGFAATPADIIDVANIGRGLVSKGLGAVAGSVGMNNVADSLYTHGNESIQNANLGEKARNYIDSFTGEQDLPMTSGDQTLDIAGGLAFPLGQVSKLKPLLTSPTKAISETAKTVSKTPVKEILDTAKELKNAPIAKSLDIIKNPNIQKAAIGAGKEAAKIGTIATALVELPDEYTGNLLADTAIKGYLASKSPALLKNTGKKIINADFLHGSNRSDNKTIQALANDIGVDLPYNAISDSKLGNFVANSVLKNSLLTDAWKEQIKNTKASATNSFKKALEKVGNINDSEDINRSVREHLTKEKSAIRSSINQAYDKLDLSQIKLSESSESLKPLKEAIDTLKNNYNPKRTPLTGDGKTVANFINDIEEIYKDVFSGNVDKLNLNGDDLKQLRSNVLSLGQHGQAYGERASLKLITDGIEKTFENFGTKKGFEDILNIKREADTLYKLDEIGRVRASLWKALTKEQAPTEALSYMTNASKIDEMAKIIGTSKEGNKIFSDLKRTKLNQILDSKILDNSNGFSFDKLSTIFNEGKKERDLIKKLAGEEAYNVLQKLAKISDRVKSSNKDFRNSSGSGDAVYNFFRVGNVLHSAFSPSSVGVFLAPDILTKVLTNKSAVARLNKAAISDDFKFTRALADELKKFNKSDKKTQLINVKKQSENYKEESNVIMDKNSLRSKFNAHIEKNKKRPKGQALINVLSSPTAKKGAEILRANPWK